MRFLFAALLHQFFWSQVLKLNLLGFFFLLIQHTSCSRLVFRNSNDLVRPVSIKTLALQRFAEQEKVNERPSQIYWETVRKWVVIPLHGSKKKKKRYFQVLVICSVRKKKYLKIKWNIISCHFYQDSCTPIWCLHIFKRNYGKTKLLKCAKARVQYESFVS